VTGSREIQNASVLTGQTTCCWIESLLLCYDVVCQRVVYTYKDTSAVPLVAADRSINVCGDINNLLYFPTYGYYCRYH